MARKQAVSKLKDELGRLEEDRRAAARKIAELRNELHREIGARLCSAMDAEEADVLVDAIVGVLKTETSEDLLRRIKGDRVAAPASATEPQPLRQAS